MDEVVVEDPADDFHQLGGAKDLPGPKATLFFAPAQAKKRQAELGPAVFGQQMVQAWQGFCQRASSFRDVTTGGLDDEF